jgi:hypothetical protein
LPLRFLADSRFGLWRDVEAHANSSLPGITAYLTPLSQLCHGHLPGFSPSRGWRIRAQFCGLCPFRLHATQGFALCQPRASAVRRRGGSRTAPIKAQQVARSGDGKPSPYSL